ncbi:adenylate kinase 4, mitochondrial-like [Drosophila nasuta]|uniref:Adenylate kinase 4, mitochondrial-like n=1 Tax=Drosophila albomicans TaxID=7291 RepID=A0A9C6WE44_DROAB|nr:adenylate kinase 4, mitochondrial-like [Drosophila albomicans]XP_060654349.1 adenylate kinase 4, mitochondrial-like [Drosophila nasuta]
MRLRGFRALIMGPPGSGKGHISEKIVKKYGAVHIAAGDILRKHINEHTPLGKEAEKYTRKGLLVPDALLLGVIGTAIYKAGNRNWILDGFPRNVTQAKHLENVANLDMVINLQIPDEAIMEMLKFRLVHVPSGRVYNMGVKAPLVPGLDDVTGERLERRADDRPKVVMARLSAFDKQMNPVIGFYRKRHLLHTITGRHHQILWPMVERYLVKRWGLSAIRSFRPKRNLDLLTCKP